MTTYCRVSNCQWQGSEKGIFYHLELHHRQLLRESKGKIYFDLSAKDLQYETLVLVCQEGLYWLSQNHQQNTQLNVIQIGVFHIGESQRMKYSLQLLGQPQQQLGPYLTQQDHAPDQRHNDLYELNVDFKLFDNRDHLEKLRLRFDRNDVGETSILGSREKQNTDFLKNNNNFRKLSADKLICAVCLDSIRHEARFCENEHFVCLDCFEAMLKYRKLRCPTCRGIYLYDCLRDVEEFWKQKLESFDEKTDGEKSE